MAMDSEPEQCLANMAGLLILNEFDNIVGYIFDLRVRKYYPKIHMIDGLLKDKISVIDQKISIAFAQLFFVLSTL